MNFNTALRKFTVLKVSFDRDSLQTQATLFGPHIKGLVLYGAIVFLLVHVCYI